MEEQSVTRRFRQEHGFVEELAEGAEGKVSAWRSKYTGMLIAVKEPVKDTLPAKKALESEIVAMTKLGQHQHVVRFLGYAGDWDPHSPALFYEFCELGDVQDYNYKIFSSGMWVPEPTIWKFFIDMTKALDYLHNSFDVTYVHGDFKPNNILVSRPPGDYTGIPFTPIFKLADFSHLTEYRRGDRGLVHRYCGTWEFAPPIAERDARLAPPVDIFAISASLQTLAWGILPVRSNKNIMEQLVNAGDPDYPPTEATLEKLLSDNRFRKSYLAVVYRPMNAHPLDQVSRYDMPQQAPPYSDTLNEWYTMCLNEDPRARVTSKVLKEHFLPIAEQQLRLHVRKLQRDNAIMRVRILQQKARDRQKALAEDAKSKASAAHNLAKRPVAEKKDPAQATARRRNPRVDGKGKRNVIS